MSVVPKNKHLCLIIRKKCKQSKVQSLTYLHSSIIPSVNSEIYYTVLNLIETSEVNYIHLDMNVLSNGMSELHY